MWQNWRNNRVSCRESIESLEASQKAMEAEDWRRTLYNLYFVAGMSGSIIRSWTYFISVTFCVEFQVTK